MTMYELRNILAEFLSKKRVKIVAVVNWAVEFRRPTIREQRQIQCACECVSCLVLFSSQASFDGLFAASLVSETYGV